MNCNYRTDNYFTKVINIKRNSITQFQKDVTRFTYSSLKKKSNVLNGVIVFGVKQLKPD